ncbi:hypothetical protein [Neptuniibacter sp. QD57_21]|uniref:hypothetical protein n=1 Tax=Neptuniibacter sp. QD57_21 TaxID=3398213 RepID=UPI0039F581C2
MNDYRKQRLIFTVLLFVFAFMIAKEISIFIYAFPVMSIIFYSVSLNDGEKFDVIDMFWFMAALFFVVAPAATLTAYNDSFLFGMGVVVEYPYFDFLYPQEYLLKMYVVVSVGLFLSSLIIPFRVGLKSIKDTAINIKIPFLLIVLSVLFFILISQNGGIENTLKPRFEKEFIKPVYLVLFEAIYMIVLFIGLSGLKDNRNLFFVFVLCFMHLVLFNPLNTARFTLIIAWLPVLIILFPSMLNYRKFAALIMFGLIVLMPILSLTTRFGAEGLVDFSLSMDKFLAYLDVHTIILHTFEYVDKYGHGYGESLLALFLFFIPRDIWPDKPHVIGLVIGGDLYNSGIVGTSNLSGPVLADLYYDFGYLGVIFGTLMFSLLFRFLVRKNLLINGNNINGLILLSALPILTRGSVGAVIALPFFMLVFINVIVFIKGKVVFTKGE